MNIYSMLLPRLRIIVYYCKNDAQKHHFISFHPGGSQAFYCQWPQGPYFPLWAAAGHQKFCRSSALCGVCSSLSCSYDCPGRDATSVHRMSFLFWRSLLRKEYASYTLSFLSCQLDSGDIGVLENRNSQYKEKP